MLSLAQTFTAVATNMTVYFLASGGLPPYTYNVIPGGAGGVIDAYSGNYVAPSFVGYDPSKSEDVIQVTDGNGDTATATILVSTTLILFCDILKHELKLDDNHIYLWDQKISQPKDGGLYIAVSIGSCKAFGSSNHPAANGNQIQSVNMQATLDIDIISRSAEARDRKEEVLLAINSVYSQQQQAANSFLIGRLPAGSRFINLSNIDGAAIPYRFRVSLNIQYAKTITQQAQYYDKLDGPEIEISS